MKTDARIYLMAAERLEGWCSCNVIDALLPGESDAEKQLRWDARREFEEVFCPEVGAMWWWGIPNSPENDQQARMLALLFMHEIALDEELGRVYTKASA